mmetsp:Transcript_47497/g.111078  ORF Transcript_47497/g.111078 Transcript_47497/m.111078 type:complete len:505 (+) Transcript_47497:89-1603(+)
MKLSPGQDRYATRLKLHVKLRAPGPGERFAVLGSHEALGCWNLSAGLQLEWRGSAWETPDPVPISPCERVEFKFVRVRPGGLDWESGPNRVTEFPNYNGDLCLQGIFNGESILQPNDLEYDEGISTPDTRPSVEVEDEARLWQLRYQEAATALTALQDHVALRREVQGKRREEHGQVRSDLLRQIQGAQREAGRLSGLPPEDASTPETVASAGAEEDASLWQHRYEDCVSSLSVRQQDAAINRQDLERRRAEHAEVASSLWRQIQDAQREARGLSGLSQEQVAAREKGYSAARSVVPPDIANIPSPSFPSSVQSTPSRAQGKSTSVPHQRRSGLQFSSPRLDVGHPRPVPSAVRREQRSQQQAGSGRASDPPAAGVGHHGSGLESFRRKGSKASRSESALAALRAAKGASPVSSHSAEEEDAPRQAYTEREESVLSSGQRYERVARPATQEQRTQAESSESDQPPEGDTDGTLVASKEVAAAFASAKARLARLKPVREAAASDS